MKFKVGDIVEVIDVGISSRFYKTGDTGEVTSIDRDGCIWFRLHNKSWDSTKCAAPKQLKVINALKSLKLNFDTIIQEFDGFAGVEQSKLREYIGKRVRVTIEVLD